LQFKKDVERRDRKQPLYPIPDACFSLHRGGGVRHFFLEADRSKMPHARFSDKLKGYRDFMKKPHPSLPGVSWIQSTALLRRKWTLGKQTCKIPDSPLSENINTQVASWVASGQPE
jgi:hypothetical protein